MVYPDSEFETHNLGAIIISSHAYRHEMRQEIENIRNDIPIIDLYDEMRLKGLEVDAPFYRNLTGTYVNVLYYRGLYFRNQNAENLKNLIVSYLMIYDFLNYYHYSDLYCDLKYSGWEDIYNAETEIKCLLADAKSKIRKRKKDIIVSWNDQVGYEEL